MRVFTLRVFAWNTGSKSSPNLPACGSTPCASTRRVAVYGTAHRERLERIRELQREGFKFWLEAFFSDDYARLDTALDGAVEAVRRLTASGITIAYVTARPEKMTPVTVECLARLGFPIGVPGTILVTRPESAGSDEEAKALAYGWLASLGTPILSADNEPGHVNATLRRFPEALNVLVDTRHSPGAPDLAAEALRLPRLLDAILL